MAIELVDIGVNLSHRSFRQDLDEVLARALTAGVAQMVVTGTSVRGSREAAELAAHHAGTLFATVGVHPHDAKQCDDQTLEVLRGLASLSQVVAIGECGLDFNRDFSPRPVQERWFAAQVGLAVELGMPLFLHERDARERFVAILDDFAGRLPPTVVHCFTGSSTDLTAYLERGLYIGITGWVCDERRGGPLQALIKEIPLNRLMVETDAPFLVPRDLRPKPRNRRNEPSFLPHITQRIATCGGWDYEEVAAITTATARAFFRIGGDLDAAGSDGRNA